MNRSSLIILLSILMFPALGSESSFAQQAVVVPAKRPRVGRVYYSHLETEQDRQQREAEEREAQQREADELAMEDDFDDEDDRDLESRVPARKPFGPWPRKSLRESRIDIRESSARAPEDRSDALVYGGTASDWTQFQATTKVYAWEAPNIKYQPLFFEDVPLERYGQTHGWHRQPFHSAGNFFSSVLALPNQMQHDHPYSCDSPLGFCRPGDCVKDTKQFQFFGKPPK